MSAGLRAAVERVTARLKQPGAFRLDDEAHLRTILSALSSQAEVMEAMASALQKVSRDYHGFLDGNGRPCPTLARARTALSQYHSLTGEKA